MPRTRLFWIPLAALLAAPGALAADPPRPSRKDAAESVQEGNVQQWIEYYQRTRPQAPKPPTEPAPAAQPPAPTPAPASPAR